MWRPHVKSYTNEFSYIVPRRRRPQPPHTYTVYIVHPAAATGFSAEPPPGCHWKRSQPASIGKFSYIYASDAPPRLPATTKTHIESFPKHNLYRVIAGQTAMCDIIFFMWRRARFIFYTARIGMKVFHSFAYSILLIANKYIKFGATVRSIFDRYKGTLFLSSHVSNL